MNISEKIKEVRKSVNKTQQEFSESINISRGSLSQIESGRANPTIDILESIIKTYNLDANFFFQGSVPKPVPRVNNNTKNDIINTKDISNDAPENAHLIKNNYKDEFGVFERLIFIDNLLPRVCALLSIHTSKKFSKNEVDSLKAISETTLLPLKKLLSKNMKFSDNEMNMAYIATKKGEELLEEYINELGKDGLIDYDSLIEEDLDKLAEEQFKETQLDFISKWFKERNISVTQEQIEELYIKFNTDEIE